MSTVCRINNTVTEASEVKSSRPVRAEMFVQMFQRGPRKQILETVSDILMEFN